MAQASLQVEGLKEFRRELKQVSNDLPKELRKLQKQLADEVASKAQGIASGMGGVTAKASGAIRAYATRQQASIGVPSGGIPAVAFWGALKRTGWYAHIHSPGGRPQHPKWVGNSWEAAERGQGPYAINDALADAADTIEERYAQMIMELAARAFPD